MKITIEDAKLCLQLIGINIKKMKITIKDVRDGMKIEMEHGKINPITNVTNDNPIMTCKIALAHLFEDPKYYEKLKQLNL